MRIVPSNGLEDSLAAAASSDDVMLTDGAVINTTTGAITNGDGTSVVVASALKNDSGAGVPIRVFAFRNLSVGDTEVIGVPALALMVDGTFLLDGTLVLQRSQVPGQQVPGAADCRASGKSVGGFGSAGGAGPIDPAGQQPNGNASLVPLRGGCHGGGEISETCSDGAEYKCDHASGGGAIQVTAAGRIELADGAILGAPGYTSEAAPGSSSDERLGEFGGGAGGAILLETPSISFGKGSRLVANGAGGSAYSAGDNGSLSLEPAEGGSSFTITGRGIFGCQAGAGATGEAEAQAAEDSNDRNCGGGGGVGRIRLNTVEAPSFESGVIFSPAPSEGELEVR